MPVARLTILGKLQVNLLPESIRFKPNRFKNQTIGDHVFCWGSVFLVLSPDKNKRGSLLFINNFYEFYTIVPIPEVYKKSKITRIIKEGYGKDNSTGRFSKKKKATNPFISELAAFCVLVPEVGVEPTRAQGPLDFESSASTSFTTPAQLLTFTVPSFSLSRIKQEYKQSLLSFRSG